MKTTFEEGDLVRHLPTGHVGYVESVLWDEDCGDGVWNMYLLDPPPPLLVDDYLELFEDALEPCSEDD